MNILPTGHCLVSKVGDMLLVGDREAGQPAARGRHSTPGSGSQILVTPALVVVVQLMHVRIGSQVVHVLPVGDREAGEIQHVFHQTWTGFRLMAIACSESRITPGSPARQGKVPRSSLDVS